ncbi:MAG: hypothetical protein HFE77_05965 [Clostridiales bacterium]|nr:hypothetical protein [Clostridiales bacterium]
MAVVKCKLIKITGAVALLDDVLCAAVQEEGFCAENAAGVLRSTTGYTTINEVNPYTSCIEELQMIAKGAGVSLLAPNGRALPAVQGSFDDVKRCIEEETASGRVLAEEIARTEERLGDDEKILAQLMHIININVPLDELFKFQYFKLRFGHMPLENYKALSRYSSESDDYFFFVSSIEGDDVWGLYVVLSSDAARVDSLFESLLFERVIISGRAHGTPRQAYEQMKSDLESAKQELADLRRQRDDYAAKVQERLQEWYAYLSLMNARFKMKTKVLLSDDDHFVLYGYASAKEAPRIAADLGGIEGVSVTCTDPAPDQPTPPPTRLKNLWFFRPFEEYVKMYGLPSYNELDPTPLVALSYMLFFGIMFGDVGQGAVIILAGLLMWKFKGMFVGRILTRVGITSMAFGFFYGPVFGFEDLLPFGYKVNEGSNMNTVLIGSVVIGAVMISISILMNIINGIRQKNLPKVLFSNNSVASLIFYWSLLILVLLFMNFLPAKAMMPILIVIVVLTLLMIMMKEPLEALLKRRKRLVHSSWLDYLLESFFELFETVLSFVTNTISYIRLGAFALNHVGMMSVVFLLAGSASGSHNPVILVLGNLFVIGFEGMIVCIQALRLEFYEIFGRFYEGQGRALSDADDTWKT